jgi:signal transduction histidine kinase
MDLGRPSLRALAVLLAVAIPPLVAFAIVVDLAPDLVDRIGIGTALLAATAATILWAGAVAVVAARVMTAEVESMVQLAEQGVANRGKDSPEGSDDGLSLVQRRLAASLEERNRQIGSLSELVRTAPIADRARAVAASMVEGARHLTGDPTWVLAVLRSEDGPDLANGVYGPEPDAPPGPIEDVHRWAATVGETDGSIHGARLSDGPWGAFAIVDVAVADELRAVLMAPWEGRPVPSPADLNLFSLLGRHAATAIEHALLYARLRRQTDELNRMAAVQTDFLQGITHDLQTPLTSIGVLATELRRSPALDATGQADLEVIVRQADRLRRMVGQLLAVSRLEAGALNPRQEVFHAPPIIERTWQALHATQHRLRLESDGAAHLLVGDPDRFEQILWAVLDNAVKYSPAGSEVRVHLGAEADPAEEDRLVATITVDDEGAGMDEDTRVRAFEQFYRSADARRLAPDGSGIGLYAARGLMEAMDGSIQLESRLGAGTSVTLRLPAEATEGIDEPDTDPKATPGAVGQGRS